MVNTPLPTFDLPGPSPEQVAEGTSAITEAAAVAKGVDLSDREGLNRLNAMLRKDKLEYHWHIVLVIGLYFVGFCAAVLFACMVYNMVSPVSYRFLDADGLARIQTFLFSGALGSGVTAAARKLSNDNKKP